MIPISRFESLRLHKDASSAVIVTIDKNLKAEKRELLLALDRKLGL